MAEFLQADLNWRNAQIYLKLVVTDASEVEPTQASMQGMLQKLRLDAIPQVLVADGRSFQEILLESSQDADLIFLGIATPQANVCHYHTMVQDQTGTLPTIAFVLAAPEFAFTQIFTDEPVFHP